MRRILSKILPEASLSLLVCLLALLPLLDLRRSFGVDWFNHLWAAEYTGLHILHAKGAPDVFNTPQLLGSPDPLFYASKFYAILGPASIWLGSGLTFRLFALLILLLQFWHVRRAAGLFCPWPWASCLLAVAVTWETYPLVDLYERNDLTEFTASTFLVSAIATLFVLLVRTAHEENDPYSWIGTGLLYGFAAVTNPLTGLYGGIFLGVLGLVGLATIRQWRILRFGLSNVLLLGALLSPWLYVVLKFGHLVQISNAGVNAGLFQISYASTPFAALLSTLHPASTEPAFVHLGVDTRVLKIPLCVSLLFCALGLAALSRTCPRRADSIRALLATLLWVSYAVFALCLLVYCSPGCSGLLAHAFDIMQYPYRLITYVDASLLVGTLSLLGLVDWERLRSRFFLGVVLKTVILISYLFAASALGAKLWSLEDAERLANVEHGVERRFSVAAGSPQRVTHWYPGFFRVDKTLVAQLPATWYAEGAYAVDSGYSAIIHGSTRLGSIDSPFAVDPQDGAVRPVEVAVRDATELTTNIAPFPWNVISLDGRPVEARNMAVVADAFKTPGVNPEILRVHVPPGRHLLTYAFIPDRPWPFLRNLSWVVLLSWTGLWLTVTTRKVAYRIRLQGKPILILPTPSPTVGYKFNRKS